MKILKKLSSGAILLMVTFLWSAFFNPISLKSQRNLRYKDIYNIVLNKSKEEAYSNLLVYQKQHPYFANTYFQLGLIAQYWSKEYDALTDIQDVKFFIYNTNLYFGLANNYIDEKEVRKNEKYYRNVPRFKALEKLKFEDLNSFIIEQIQKNKDYKNHVEIVTDYFNSSIKHYNNCIRIFKEINQENNKIKDIYLNANEATIKKLDELKKSFDSTIYYFQNYQTAIKTNPIKNYKQKYKLYPIETYRLQGLTGTDFLHNQVALWNYGEWVNNVNEVLNNDIKTLRKKIDQADKKINNATQNILNSQEYKSDFKSYKIDEKLMNQIAKYDYQSILIPFFEYKEQKEDFISLLKSPFNKPDDSLSRTPLIQRLKYYEELIKQKQYTDSIITNFSKQITEASIKKYQNFFDSNYKGMSGVRNYVTNEIKTLNNQLNVAFNNLETNLIPVITNSKNIVSLSYKKHTIDLIIANKNFSQAKAGKYYITSYIKSNSGNYYASGYIKQRTSRVSAFVLKTNKLESIEWLKIYSVSSITDDFGSYIQSDENGCHVIITSIKDNNLKNSIFNISPEGKLINKTNIKVNLFPRFFTFDDINQQYIIAFKGKTINPFNSENDMLIINKYDSELKLSWSKAFQLHGELVNIISMNNQLYIISNYSKLISTNKTYLSKAGNSPEKTNAIIIILESNGNLNKLVPISNENPFIVTNAIKINSNTFNLLGFKTEMFDYKNSDKNVFPPLLYYSIDPNGNIKYNNWKN